MMLEISHLTKKYGTYTAVDDLTLSIAQGEIHAFIGHNGAGKTTTLKSVAGILSFDEGTITVDGHDVVHEALAAKQEMAYIPDNPDLYDYLRGIDYLNFIGSVYRVDDAVLKQRVEKYARMLEIYDELASPIRSYSHGMKQKAALISAFIHEPKLILMDEPFVGLDPKASHILKKLMREFCDGGSAIFFSTHVLEVAEKLCDRVAIIRQGKLIRSGTMEDVVKDESLEEVFLELDGDEQ